MGLRELAESDLGMILEDSVNGFGLSITVTNPAGKVLVMTGYSNDIAQVIDPDTGLAVSGRAASVSLRIATLNANTMGLPEAIPDTTKKPWIIEFADYAGLNYKFKVSSASPDRAKNVVLCDLENYKT